MVIEFNFFNLNKKKNKISCISANISYHIQHIFANLLLEFPFYLFLTLIFSNEVHSESENSNFKCTGLIPSDLGNPYIHSATALCDSGCMSMFLPFIVYSGALRTGSRTK